MEHWKTPPTPWIFKLTGSSDNLSLLLLLLRELTLKIPPWRPHPVSSHVWFCVLYTIFYFENAGAAHVPCVPLANCGGTDGLLMFAEHTHTHTYEQASDSCCFCICMATSTQQHHTFWQHLATTFCCWVVPSTRIHPMWNTRAWAKVGSFSDSHMMICGCSTSRHLDFWAS